jgi:hypothetical protein
MTEAIQQPDFRTVQTAISLTGLVLRGGFHTDPALDKELGDGTLLLIGMVGGAGWNVFSTAQEARDGLPDPLDRWSKRLINGLARQFGGRAFYPSDGPPYSPFQRWAQRAEPVFSSPLGLLIHPVYGLSHSYRGALLLPSLFDLPATAVATHPCHSCRTKPCLTACPVSAYSSAGYDLAACAAHLNSLEQTCRRKGCLARMSCPVGLDFAQTPAQIAFHMQAFYAARAALPISDRHTHPLAD